MTLDGVENVVLEKFGKSDTDEDRVVNGKAPQMIEIAQGELPVCNLNGQGCLEIRLRGGRKG